MDGNDQPMQVARKGYACPTWKNKRPSSLFPNLCQELYYKYCRTFTNESFDEFYNSTFPVFISFAVEKINGTRLNIEPQEIVNRLYGILVAHASNRKRVPIKVLLSWCFGVICNLIREEQRSQGRLAQVYHRPELEREVLDPLLIIMNTEESQRRKKLYDKVLRLIENPNDILTDRERNVMNLFYCKGLKLKDISEALSTSPENVAVILFRSRKRIASMLKENPLRSTKREKRTRKIPLKAQSPQLADAQL